MGINQEGANAESSQHNKNSKKKKKNLNVGTSSCKCTGIHPLDGERDKTDLACSNPLEIKNKVPNESEGSSSKGKKVPKSKKVKGNVNLNSAENSVSKKKDTSEQSIKKEGAKSAKSDSHDLTDVCVSQPDKEKETEKEGIPKKRKKQNKGKKAVNTEKVTENSIFDDIGEKTEPEIKDLKSLKNPAKKSEHSDGNKCEQVCPNKGDSKSGETECDYKRLSKSKRRRIRKKRILAALGLTGCAQTKSVKSRKKKSNTVSYCNEKAKDFCPEPENADVTSFPNEVFDLKLQEKLPDSVDKIFRKVDTAATSLQHQTLSASEAVEEKSIDKTFLEDKINDEPDLSLSLSHFIDGDSVLNGSSCCDSSSLGIASSTSPSKESAKRIDKLVVETNVLSTGNVKQSIEASSTSSRREEALAEKVNIPNFLSHDNVEGLFRSALLNDITLSSRCSEKEVKNFFNTYGTFSEKNRTQFAEVEKLLLSNNKLDDTVESSLFECEKSVSEESQEKVPFDLQSSSVPTSNLEVSPDCEKFAGCSIEAVRKQTEGETHNSNNSFVYSSSSATTENVCLNKGVGWGPIYTSPNPENKVTSSVNSPQIQRENKVSLSPLSASFNSSLSRPEKSESRLLEIVENVLLVHERVREQLTSDKKIPSQRYCPNLPGTGLFNQSEGKDFMEKTVPSNKNKNSSVNSIVKLNKSDFDSTEEDLEAPLFKFDHISNANRVRPLHECFTSCLHSEDPVQANSSVESQKADLELSKMQKPEKTKEEIKAERESKKLAKMARKAKTTAPGPSINCASSGDVSAPKRTNEPPKAQVVSNDLCDVSTSSLVAKGGGAAQKCEKKDTSTKDSSNSSTNAFAGSVNETKTVVEGEVSKSKAELKAERRAKQEAQRAAKAQQQQKPVERSTKPAVQGPNTSLSPAEPPVKPASVKLSKPAELGKEIKPVVLHKVKLFNHLYIKQEASVPKSISATSHLHPAVVRLGVQYATKVVVGSNARCLALLSAVKQVIEDYRTPPQKEFSRGLEAILQPSMAFLQECRPLSVSMTNAIKHVKWQMRHLPNNISDVDAKRKLQEAIDTYIREQIEVAGQAICNTVIGKISSGDVILTYGCSSLLQRILIQAHRSGTKFSVLVVDARPWREGKEMLRRLVENGLHCTYVVIAAASFIMREATKVFLGAHALLANGYVMSRAGSSQVALLAHSYNVPVLVCCETHKFSERAQTDSIVYNELGAPDELVMADSCSKDHPLSKWKTVNHLTPLNITYDVTPPDLVTAVVTELGILPCTSVPVIIRVKPIEIGY